MLILDKSPRMGTKPINAKNSYAPQCNTKVPWNSNTRRKILQDESETSHGSGQAGEGLGSTSGDNRNLRLSGLGLLSLGLLSLGSLRLLGRRSRVLGLLSGRSRVLGLLSGRGRVLRLLSRRSRVLRLDGVLGLGLRDNNNRRLARSDGLRRADGLGRADRRVNGLALSVSALLVAVAVILALVEVVAILLNVTDKLAGVILRVVNLAAGSVAGDLLVALLVLVVRVVAASVLTDLELVPCVVVTFARRAKVVLTNHLPLGAGRAVDLRSTVVTVADDDNTGRNNRKNSCDGLGGNLATLGEGNSSSGGGGRESLSDEVGVDNGLSFTGVDTDGDVDGEENVNVNALAAHDARARGAATTVDWVVSWADNVTLVRADSGGLAEVKLSAAVTALIVQTEVVGASTCLSTFVGIVILAGVGKSEAGETIVREAAKEVEAVWVSNTSSSSAGGSSGSLSASCLGTDGNGTRSGSLSLETGGGGVGKASGGGELSGDHIAHGQGEDISVTHLEGWSVENEWVN
jgi:hypothetical protein